MGLSSFSIRRKACGGKMNFKESKKIARQKRRINILSTGLMVEGLAIIAFSLLSGFIAKQFHIEVAPGIGGGQWLLIAYGIAKACWGWSIR